MKQTWLLVEKDMDKCMRHVFENDSSWVWKIPVWGEKGVSTLDPVEGRIGESEEELREFGRGRGAERRRWQRALSPGGVHRPVTQRMAGPLWN